MRIPAMLYGDYAEVQERCRAAIERSGREEQPVPDALEAGGMLDTAEHPGPIVVGGPGWMVEQHVCFHCYVPWQVLTAEESRGPIGVGLEDAVFDALLGPPWGVLCLLSNHGMDAWFSAPGPDRYRRYLRAVLRYWDELEAEGPRYASAGGAGRPLWDVAFPVHKALVRLGVPVEVVRTSTSLPAAGLPALMAQVDPALAGDLLALVAAAAGRLLTGAPPERDTVIMGAAMEAAMLADDAEAVRQLILAGEPVNAMVSTADDTLLFWAIMRGHTGLVPLLLDHGADIEDRWAEGESPLMMATQGGQRDTVQLLLDRGADPDYATHKGPGLVRSAELGGDPELIALLKRVTRQRG